MRAIGGLRLMLCCLAVVLVVAGCGDSKDSASSSTAATTQKTTPDKTTPTQTTTTPEAIVDKLKKPAPLAAHPGENVETLQVRDVVKGKGATLQSGDTGTFNFIGGRYENGKVFEDTWKSGKPFDTVVEHNVVIDGWWQGLTGMRVGGRRVLVIPASLGFVNNANPKVKGVTWFIVDLLAVKPAAPPGVGGSTPAAEGQGSVTGS